MKKILMVFITVLLLTGCGVERKESEHYTCVDKNQELNALVTLELEFKNDQLYFMKQTQTIEYESAEKAKQEADQYEANAYTINDSYKNMKAYTEVNDNKVNLITEHNVSKFTQEEKDVIALKENKKEVLLTNFRNSGFICEKEEK